jgi:hypothetical protein
MRTALRTALDVFPPEVWLRIIRVSCADTSFTARTLSLVSLEIYELSKPYRVQSVALRGISRIFSFYKALRSSPAQFSRVVHLFIGCPHLRQENDRLRRYAHDNLEVFEVAAELKSQLPAFITQAPATGAFGHLSTSPPNPDSVTESILGACIQRILIFVGDSLKHLHLHFVGFTTINLLPDHLLLLEDLVIYDARAPFQVILDTPRADLRLPSLRKLRIGYHNSVSSRIIPKLSTLFPSLIQFSLIQAMISEEHFNDLMDMIKKLDTVWPESERTATVIASRETQKKLIAEVDTIERLTGPASNWYKQLTDTAATTHRVEIVRKESQWTDLQKAETEWVAATRKWIEADWAVDSL